MNKTGLQSNINCTNQLVKNINMYKLTETIGVIKKSESRINLCHYKRLTLIDVYMLASDSQLTCKLTVA